MSKKKIKNFSNGAGLTMSEEQLKAAMEAIQQANKRAKESPDYARRTLIEEGVYTEKGELTKHYR